MTTEQTTDNAPSPESHPQEATAPEYGAANPGEWDPKTGKFVSAEGTEAPSAGAEVETLPASAAAPYALAAPNVPDSELPENYQELIGDFADVAASVGVNQTVAQRLVDAVADAAYDVGTDYDKPLTGMGAREYAAQHMQGYWGEDYDANLGYVARAVGKLGGERFAAYLDETGLGNSPAVLVALARFGAGQLSLSKADAEKQLAKIMGDPSSAYWNTSLGERDRKRVIAEVRQLNAVIRAGDAPKREPVRPPAPAASSSAKTIEIRAELSKLAAQKTMSKADRERWISLVARIS